MDLRPRAHRWGFVCLGASVMSGCATYVTPPPLPTQADVRVGPAIELLAFKTTFGDHVRAVPDAAGRVHVLIAAAADPDDGSVLLGGRMLLQSGHWKFTSQFPDIYSRWYKWRAASAGSGTYHGVASYKRSYFSSDRRIAYGRLIGTTWETAELGPAAKEALDIAAFGPEKAFVIWETDQGVVGHWVEIAVRKE